MPELRGLEPRPRVLPEARLVRLHQSLPELRDPWALLQAAAFAGRRIFAWSDPTDGRTLLAVGVAHELRVEGPQRFAAAEEAWRVLDAGRVERSASADEPIDPGLPCLVGGFAFSAKGQRSGPWGPFKDGSLWVPELLIHSGPRGCVAAISVLAPSEDLGQQLSERLRWLRGALAEADAAPAPAPLGALPAAGDAERQRWHREVQAARAEMAEGRLHKVVLARSEPLTTPAPVDPLATAWALRLQQPSCTCWALRLESGEAFVGATPEELVRLQGRHLRTVALAGTRRRGQGEEDEALGEAMLASDKERHEQRLVLDAIRGALEPLSENLDIPDRPGVARFAKVQHLRSTIEAQLKPGVSLFRLLGRLHPTPAVGGLPRPEALRWLAAHEDLDRGWYAGPIGWVAPGDRGVFVVGLRSALIIEGRATAFAGCGLVEASEPEAEWEETLHKLDAVRDGLSGEPSP
ncbi:MAG: isochorismate synthase [Alphaproteobacteria bacterium]|nr:isochorismate synthase [Alphaproteobacteria bacterium]